MNKSPTVSLQQRANNQAERLGFEPRERLPAHRISSAARSTTPASFPCFADERVSAYGLQK